MDLVGEEQNAVAGADIRHPAELLLRPYPSRGVVGGAEEEQLGVGAGTQGLQRLEIQGIALFPAQQRIGKGRPARGLEDAEEGGIGGGLEDDALSRLGKGLHSLSHGVDHAEGVDNPARLDLPAVAAAHPSRHSGAIRLIHGGVAVDAELGGLPQGGDDLRRGYQVHVRDGKGDDVGVGDACPLQRLPLGGADASPGAKGGEIIHRGTSSFLSFGSMNITGRRPRGRLPGRAAGLIPPK